MAKRIQPKLHNDRVHLDTMAYYYAAKEAADALLCCLWLAAERDEAGYAEARDLQRESAVREATLLLDYLALHGGPDGPEYYLDRSIARDKHHAPQRDQALQLMATLIADTTPERSAA